MRVKTSPGSRPAPAAAKPAAARTVARTLARAVATRPASAPASAPPPVADDEANLTSVEQVTGLIRQAIIQGLYGPSERIKISEAAQRFGVSAMPVREALRKLEGEGMVAISPNRGATVRAVDDKFIEDIYEVRTMLESMVLGRCIQALTMAKLQRLEALVQAHRMALLNGPIEDILNTGRAFHTAIVEMAGNREVQRLFDRGWDTIVALRTRFGYSRERLDHMADEYAQLVQALRRQDPREAENVIRMHNRAGMEDLLELIAQSRPASRTRARSPAP